ncbi:unnamed protein product, partial [Mesorhabditis belari]|uniref:G-protein coupled receptors family 1 profile domain-containing protein n=1 Tax=Mesorhabditis belari TaxID=2138241 RepID=A0AAF3EMR3_9BILA
MAIICSIYFFANFLVAIPVLIDSYEYLESPITMKYLSSLNTFGHYTEQLILLVISLNRFLLVSTSLKRNEMRRVFEFLHIICWLYGLAITVVPNLLGCFKVFSPKTLNFTFSCAKCGLMLDYYMISGEAAPVIMIFLYSLMVLRLRSLQKRLQRRDLRLTLQCFLICFFSWLASFFFFFMPKFFAGSFVSSILVLTVSTVSKTANPVILFVFNVKIRDAIGTFLTTGKAIPSECITSTVYFKKPCQVER